LFSAAGRCFKFLAGVFGISASSGPSFFQQRKKEGPLPSWQRMQFRGMEDTISIFFLLLGNILLFIL
jgi:predicted Abi (CAAX) family protease